jgi:adenylate kinase
MSCSASNEGKPIVVFVLGGPGAGKGTQSERIVRDYGFTHFSVGDLLREEKKSGSETAKLIDEYIAEGKLVPAKIPVGLVKKAMEKAGWTDNYYLVDGFPRNLENLEAWESVFNGIVDVKFTLFYECSFETMEARILERSKISGRSDDNPESLKKRFVTYDNETRPVVEFFTQKGVIRKINAERNVDEVYADTRAILDTIKTELVKKTENTTTLSGPQAQAQQIPDQGQEKPNCIFVLGGPGAGKGTQCEKIISEFGLKHLSVGDLLREEKKSGSQLAKEIEEYMTQGKLVPSEVPVRLLKQAIDNAPQGTNFLIDGFPRNRENIEEWNKIVGNTVEVKRILFYDCSFETMETRILERAKISGRSDDNIESLKKRFETYQQESAPVVDEYQKTGIVTKIHAERTVDEVYGDTKTALTGLFAK